MSDLLQNESLSKLKKGYKPVLMRKKGLICEFGCLGTFRSVWDKHQHMVYAHELESGATTLRSINEAVRSIGRVSPVDSRSVDASTPRKGHWQFVPRSTAPVDFRSTKTGESGGFWRTGLSRVLSVTKKGDKGDQPQPQPQPQHRSIRSQNISNPIPHPRLLETVERIGDDLEVAQRRVQNGTNGLRRIQHPSSPAFHTSGAFDNPIALEEKDFDLESNSDGSSPPSSPSQIATPIDGHTSTSVYGNNSIKQDGYSSPFSGMSSVIRPPFSPQVSSRGSFSRPTPSAYPLLLRNSSTSSQNLVNRPLRPPIPARHPARQVDKSSSEDGHSSVYPHRIVPHNAWMRKSPSHGALRI
ncbi:hypothetical protein FS842_003282 [Serendipita sp. 407]|nr:hypothetical protein FS842_003282 [Serendipita sp. 407]